MSRYELYVAKIDPSGHVKYIDSQVPFQTSLGAIRIVLTSSFQVSNGYPPIVGSVHPDSQCNVVRAEEKEHV